MTSSDNSFIENYIQRISELSQSSQRIPSAAELEKVATDLGISADEIEEAQQQSQAHFTRAQGYMSLKHWDDAIEELQAAVALCPSQENLLLSLATAHLGRWHQRHRREDVENVRLRIKECLSLKPDSEEALQLLAKLDRACQWHQNLLVGLILGLGSFVTTSSLVLFWPQSLFADWEIFWHRPSQLEQLEQQLWREIELLRQEQEQLREEVWSSQSREQQRYQDGFTQLNQRLQRLEETPKAWRYPVLFDHSREYNH